MEGVVKRLEGKKDEDILEVFKWFRSHVIDNKLEPSIEHQELVSDWNISLLGVFSLILFCLLYIYPSKSAIYMYFMEMKGFERQYSSLME